MEYSFVVKSFGKISFEEKKLKNNNKFN